MKLGFLQCIVEGIISIIFHYFRGIIFHYFRGSPQEFYHRFMNIDPSIDVSMLNPQFAF